MEGLTSRNQGDARTGRAPEKPSRFDGRGMGLNIGQAGLKPRCVTYYYAMGDKLLHFVEFRFPTP